MRKTGRNFPAGFNNGKNQIISPSDSELLPSSPHPLLPARGLHLYNVKLNKVPIALLDDSADYLTAEITFSYTGIEVLTAFNERPTQLGGE